MNYCEKCGKMVNTIIVDKKQCFPVYGEKIEIECAVAVCEECGEAVFDEDLDNQALLTAYQKFREIHKYLSPKEIRKIREQYGLSQRSFAKLLNWGDKTIFRYENGSLQDRAHDSILKMLRNPKNMRSYLDENELKISQKVKERILKKIGKGNDFLSGLVSLFGEEVSIENGFRVFDYDKYCAMIRYFIDHNKTMYKVKLLKLMNYADMLFFSENGVSISGSRYLHYQHGPVPEHFDLLLDLMTKDSYIGVDEMLDGDYLKYRYYSGKKDTEDVLSKEEIAVLDRVNRFFRNYSSKDIADYSHQEEAYQKTKMYEVIPYSCSCSLKEQG